MAPKLNIRTARATVIAVIAALSVLALLAAPVSACNCNHGYVRYKGGAQCYYGGPGNGQWTTIPYSESHRNYQIYCQETGPSHNGNNYWDQLYYNNRYCYVNDDYLETGCPNRCNNLNYCS